MVVGLARELRPALGAVAGDPVDGGHAHGDEAFFVALAADAEDGDVSDGVFVGEVADFRGADAAGVHELEHGAVSQPERWGLG